MSRKYDDIIHLPHPVSTRHPQMSLSNRAAQFSPFAALTGHGDAIQETSRQTEQKVELSDDAKSHISEQLNQIQEHLSELPNVSITYFVPDTKKSGGVYMTLTGSVKKIDVYERNLVMHNRTSIPIEDIIQIEQIKSRELEGER